MTFKNAKTILFAGLIAALILPVSGMNYVNAINETANENDQKIQQFRDLAIQTGEIPTYDLLERNGQKWLKFYDDEDHLRTEQEAVKTYVERDHQQNGWNQDNVKNILKIQNFETITESVGHGHEIVLLFAQYEKLQGTYNPSEAEKKYHSWIAQRYSVPMTEVEITEQLTQITGSPQYNALAQEVANSFNALASNGAVPYELAQSDVQFWGNVVNAAHCSYDDQCDLESFMHQPGASEEAIEQIKMREVIDISFNLWDLILPMAHAWTQNYVNYTMTAYINLEACYYGNCYESWYDGTNSGSADIDVDSYGSPIEHAYRYYDMTFYGATCDTYIGSETVISDVTTTPYLAQSLETSEQVDDLNYNGCAVATTTFEADHDWIVGILVESTGSYYWTDP